LHWILAGLWLIGGLLRIYRQARFFQIEEYQNARYWRWLIASPARWEWQRPAAAWIAAAAISFLFSGQDALLLVLFGVVGVIAIWPAPQKEVKKTFVRTQRATRLLVIAWLAFGVASLAIQLVLSGTLTADGGQAAFVVTALAGTLLFLLSPLFLIVGNLLAIPVEAGVRQGYLRRARGVLRDLAPTVIGITGSYGKTSTKHYLAHILNGRYQHGGHAQELQHADGRVAGDQHGAARVSRSVDYFIVEMGAYIEGEIAEICRLAQPK
jgi:UDP-N-acetylmuramoyl-tripeptide--D-alanyl-D-alanine ligase